MDIILTELRAGLDAMANPLTRESTLRFFKEEIKTRGIRNPDAKAIGKKFSKELKSATKEEVFSICDALWESGYLEESIIACDFSYARRKEFVPADFKRFERWIKQHVNNWASCDTLCNHTVGEFLMKYPDYVQQLKKWAVSKNRWMKRAAAVSLIIPARKGLFLQDMLEIASIQLMDQDDMVQKGYGWMLKSAAESHLNEVYKFVMKHKSQMPRTALRYAIEKMPADKKAKAMEK